MALDVGGGGGDRAARFTYMQVPDFWDMVRSHDSAQHQQALQGWRQSYELVLMHRTQVEKYKEKLITAWPPQRSSAARAYIERLDHLIENLTETYNAAIANHSAYSTAIAAMDDAKRKLETIQQEHAANTVALAQHEEELKNRPRAYGKAPMPAPPASPVAAGRQEELRLQAEKLITGVSAELATAQLSLTAPKPYSPHIKMDSSCEAIEQGGGSPSVPPAASSLLGRTTGSVRASKLTPTHTRTEQVKDSQRTGTIEPPKTTKRPSEGPILGGTKPQNPPNAGFNPTQTTFPPSTLTPDPPPPFAAPEFDADDFVGALSNNDQHASWPTPASPGS